MLSMHKMILKVVERVIEFGDDFGFGETVTDF